MSKSELLARSVQGLSPSIIRVMSGMKKATSVDLSLGQPKLPPDPEVIERAFGRLMSGPSGYTETAGMMELRELVAAHHALPGRSAGKNAIITVGSEQAVFLSLLSTVDPGDEILIPQPGYPAYPGIARLLGATAVSYPITREDSLAANAAQIEARITERTRAIVLNGPSNPFGTVEKEPQLRAIAELATRHGLVVISDEIYRDLDFTRGDIPSITTMSERSILISGLSKSCAMTGLRVGYLIAPEDFVPQAALAHQLVVTCAPTLSQLAAVEIFKEPSRLKAHLPFYEEARAALKEAATGLPENAPLHLGEGAFYAILDVEQYANNDPMKLAIELFEEEDVVVVPGNAFGEGGEWFWRLSYASGADAAGEGVRRIARFLQRRS